MSGKSRFYQVVCSIVLLCLLLAPVFAQQVQNLQKIVPSDSYIPAWISDLSIEQGLVVPSSAGPWSIAELQHHLSRIEREKLSRSSQSRYDILARELSGTQMDSPHGFSGTGSLTLGLEGYFHADDTDFTTEHDWYWDQERRHPLLLVDGEAWLGPAMYLYSNFGIRNNRFASADPSSVMPTDSLVFTPKVSSNLPGSGTHDFDTPSRAFIATGNSYASLQFGRDLISWGPGYSGNLVIGDHAKYHEYVRLALFSERFKFTSLTMFMDPPGYTTRHRHPYVPAAADDPTIRMFLAHRIEFVPASWLRVEISENVMYQDTQFNAKYLNPLFIFHNLSNRSQFNAIADLTIMATVLPRLHVYASCTVDQVTAPTEGNQQPGALGYQIGTKGIVPRERGTWRITAEATYTDPFLYLRDKVDFIVMTRERDQFWGYIPHQEFLGYRYGGDALVGTLAVEWMGLHGHSGGAELFVMGHGQTNIDTEFKFGEMPVVSTPSDPVTWVYRAGLWGAWEMADILHGSTRIWARIDALHRIEEATQHKATDVQLILGVSQKW